MLTHPTSLNEVCEFPYFPPGVCGTSRSTLLSGSSPELLCILSCLKWILMNPKAMLVMVFILRWCWCPLMNCWALPETSQTQHLSSGYLPFYLGDYLHGLGGSWTRIWRVLWVKQMRDFLNGRGAPKMTTVWTLSTNSCGNLYFVDIHEIGRWNRSSTLKQRISLLSLR